MKKRYVFLFIVLYSTGRVHSMDQDHSDSCHQGHHVRVICVNESDHCFSISPTQEALLSRSLSSVPTVFCSPSSSEMTLMIRKGSYVTIAGYKRDRTTATSRRVFIADEGTILTFVETEQGWDMSKTIRRLSFADSLVLRHQPDMPHRDNS